MTDLRTPPLDEEGAMLAAEHALRLLGPDDGREAEARAASDPFFAAEVDAWTELLAPLADAVEPVAPPPELWTRIAREVGGPPRAANDNGRAVRLWRGLAVGASGLAAASLAAVVLLLARPSEPAAQVAALNTPEGATALMVAFDPDSGALLVTPGPGLQAGGRTPHLWLVNPDGGVQLVGAVDPAKAATHNLPRALSRQAGAASGLALSLEPAGHRPVDKPAGPVAATGELTEL